MRIHGYAVAGKSQGCILVVTKSQVQFGDFSKEQHVCIQMEHVHLKGLCSFYQRLDSHNSIISYILDSPETDYSKDRAVDE